VPQSVLGGDGIAKEGRGEEGTSDCGDLGSLNRLEGERKRLRLEG